MAELANTNHIHIIIASILPVHNYTPASQHNFTQRPMEKIRQINGWLNNYCAAGHCTYLDYSSAMTDSHGLLAANLSADGLHPNSAGYQIMAPLAESAVEQSLKH